MPKYICEKPCEHAPRLDNGEYGSCIMIACPYDRRRLVTTADIKVNLIITPPEPPKVIDPTAPRSNSRERAVICIDAAGKRTPYKSIASAAKALGFNAASISNCLLGTQKTTKKMRWIYANED